jgi:hypothetical protein
MDVMDLIDLMDILIKVLGMGDMRMRTPSLTSKKITVRCETGGLASLPTEKKIRS